MLSLQDEILTLFQKEILPVEFNRYAKQLKFNEKNSKPDFVVYNVSNEIIARFIQTKYGDLLTRLWENKTGIKPIIKITSKSRISQKDQIQKSEKPKSSLLFESFTFENFIVGDSNQFAYNLAKSVAENPGKQFNPLFIYGPSGLGKTHLLQSIGHYGIAKGNSVLCVTSEQFANDLTFHIANKITDKFKNKYRNCDLLLIDDIQFLVGREKAKEEFFNTFNELRKKQCQIVLTSDCKPKYLKGFEDRLISRFESGVVADITPPDLETKIAIIKRKSYDNKITLTKAVIEYIATNMGDNIREIEGIMSQILAYSRLIRAEISLEIVKNFVQDKIKEKMDQVSLDSILNIISKELNIKPSDIKSKTRTKGIVDARRIGIYLAKTLTSNSTAQIAKFFGLNDHSAVSHNIKKINELIESDDEIRLQVEELKNKIQRKKD
ncbi:MULTISPECIES: chromosomal replication initiator protein DnaA [unclassified Campylobacter]|uniref:chromosomal replication initiator protein DnaA n=1 Tax=unclassified Campylobacter TaxID=2593542 RepID=UPI0022E9E778|nr:MULTISPECIES: chromosomal replication initiator protein DnaA [unclassified Campylobacter]MDA3080118.1 chromosomal replication initiator protein DnaA [Campylobacter sp. CS_NA2]MDA3081661.1 chromosomal replication initiator protein DnaA [Campylobacter sp. CS_NA1]MDA3086175.1 chromosomal replication initiator protein DnaA [Campylobacter sp. CS_ED1]MDA3090876.1 chromosomal replication initiator protein DnaA [Campylobacter sp. CS_ED2]WBR51146.1 chromosomal replication initiator protein DnaA [Cam